MAAVPVHASDLHTIRGRYGFTPEFLTVPGIEDILARGGTAVICTEDEDVRERIADIAGHDGVSKAIDCVSGQLGADVSRALAPHGELIV